MRTLPVAVLSLALAVPIHAAERTRVYPSAADTHVSTEAWDTPPQHLENYGLNDLLYLSRNDRTSILIRFDLSSIPANSRIESARLVLNATTTTTATRRIAVYRVLRAWDEGNQTDGLIDASGRHGATGDFAFDYFGSEGTDVPWGARGMAPGTDFDPTSLSETAVAGPAVYTWDITALVRSWVRLETPNNGVVLRDLSGYSDDSPDQREFVSRQNANAASRPRLEITYVKPPPDKWRH